MYSLIESLFYIFFICFKVNNYQNPISYKSYSNLATNSRAANSAPLNATNANHFHSQTLNSRPISSIYNNYESNPKSQGYGQKVRFLLYFN